MIIVLYVDDLVITGNHHDIILLLKRQLADTFEMIDLGILHFFLGLQVLPLPDGLFLYQSTYVWDLLIFLEMDNRKACATHFQSGVKLTKQY